MGQGSSHRHILPAMFGARMYVVLGHATQAEAEPRAGQRNRRDLAEADAIALLA